MTWMNDGGLSIDPPKKPKKITGTRFGAILGENPWSTPFEMWAECTKAYVKPYEDNPSTIAGKTIEPKQIEFLSMFEDVVTPTDMYGKEFFNRTRGDFFPLNPIFGGMWDALVKENGAVTQVIEFKTTKRVEDWEDGVPEYYSLQASLYAYLLGVDKVKMICSVLTDEDLLHPEDYQVTTSNTFSREFSVSEKYPDFEEKIKQARDFYETYVLSGLSPIPTEKDADLLKELHTEYVDPDTDIDELMEEIVNCKVAIDTTKASIKDIENHYKKLTDALKKKLIKKDDNSAIYKLEKDRFNFTLTPRNDTAIDVERLKEDGLYETYSYSKPTSYTLTIKEKKEGKDNG